MNELENKIEQLEKYIEVREQEIEELQADLKEANESITWWTNRFNAVERDNRKLQDRIDKAVEYIETHIIEDSEYENYMQCEREEKEDLLDILKGDNK